MAYVFLAVSPSLLSPLGGLKWTRTTDLTLLRLSLIHIYAQVLSRAGGFCQIRIPGQTASEFNHSSRFWAIVEGILPDYKARRQSFKEVQELSLIHICSRGERSLEFVKNKKRLFSRYSHSTNSFAPSSRRLP